MLSPWNHLPNPQSMDKLSSMKLVPGAKNVGNCCFRTFDFVLSVLVRTELTATGLALSAIKSPSCGRMQVSIFIYSTFFHHEPCMVPFTHVASLQDLSLNKCNCKRHLFLAGNLALSQVPFIWRRITHKDLLQTIFSAN